MNKVIAPNVILVLRPQPHTTTVIQPEPFPFWLFFRDFQSFLTPKPFDSFVINLPAFTAEQGGYSSVSIPAKLRGQLHDSFQQSRFIARYFRLSTLSRSRLTKDLASPTFRNLLGSQAVANVVHGLAALGRA